MSYEYLKENLDKMLEKKFCLKGYKLVQATEVKENDIYTLLIADKWGNTFSIKSSSKENFGENVYCVATNEVSPCKYVELLKVIGYEINE